MNASSHANSSNPSWTWLAASFQDGSPLDLSDAGDRERLFDGIPGVVWEYDPAQRRFTYVSGHAEKLLGYPREQWLSEVGFWESSLHHADRDDAVNACRTAVEAGEDHALRYRLVHRAGRPVWVHDVVHVSQKSGRPLSLRGVMFEMRQPGEAHPEGVAIAPILDHLPDGVVLHRRDSILFLNERAAQWLGTTDRASLLGTSVMAQVCPEHRALVEADLAALDRGETSLVREISLPNLNGTRTYLELQSTRIDDTHVVMTVFRDRTEVRDLKRRLLLSDRMVTVGTLAAGTAHDLGLPLQRLTMTLERAEETAARMAPSSPEAAKLRDELEAVRDATSTVRQQVQDLSTFVAGREAELTAISLSTAVELAVRLAGPVVSPRAHLEVSGQPDLRVIGQAARLTQLVVNLLVNAAESIPSGRPEDNKVQIEWTADGSDVELKISDTGRGIPPLLLSRVCEPFFTTKPLGQGLGLGLSIAREISEAFGGRLSLESSTSGTTVVVHLKAVNSLEHDEDEPADEDGEEPSWSGVS